MRTRSYPLFVLAAGAALLLSSRLVAQQPPAATPAPGGIKIAVVDVQRAVMETEDGLRAQSSLRKYFDRRQAELNARQDELARKKDDIERQSKLLSKEALTRAMEDWQRQMMELQQVFQQYNGELSKRQNEVTGPIYGRIHGLLRKIAKKDGYDLILERQAVPYARADLDLTDVVITMYNAGEEPVGDAHPAPSGSVAPPAPPAAPAPATSAK